MRGSQYLKRTKISLPSFLLFSLKIVRTTLEASKYVEDASMGDKMVGRSWQLAFLEEKYLAKETSQQTVKKKKIN